MTLSLDARLDLLAEEVIESVYAGYNFQRLSVAQVVGRGTRYADTNAIRHMDTVLAGETFGHGADTIGTPTLTAGSPLVFLDIDPAVSWGFRVQPGALRRVVMNLFGNALKYTARGHIWVSLRQAPLRSKFPSLGSRVVLTVSDTGRGIGEEYLRSHLFTPFSQEDRLAPGTGLGLSLVRQITANLGGSVTVTSRAGRGTSVRVSVPMTRPHNPVDREPEFADRLKELKDLRVRIQGFNGSFDRIGGEHLDETATVSEATLMESLCCEWLGMQTVLENAEEPPDITISSERAFRSRSPEEMAPLAPVVVVCQNAVAAHSLSQSVKTSGVFEFISQP